MITPEFARVMARYNRWQNQRLVGAADTLDDPARRLDRGAFFGSIHGTFCHVLWGDQLWLHRFAGTPKPAVASIAASVGLVESWEAFRVERAAFDDVIAEWAEALTPSDLIGDLTWTSAALGREVSRPRAMLVTHVFNHQTHHRGQIHAMLTAAGAKPADTDLFAMDQE